MLLAAGGAVLLVGLGALAFVLNHRAGSGQDGPRTVAPPAGSAAAARSAAATPSSTSPSAASAPAVGPSTVRPQVTDPVRDGDLEFTVTAVRTEAGPLGEGALQRRPVGRFVLVTVAVRNRGREPVQFDFGSQLLDDAKGRQFDADDEAGSYLDQAAAFEQPIEGGRTVTGVLVFDLPADVLPTAVDLRAPDSVEGVSVPLG